MILRAAVKRDFDEVDAILKQYPDLEFTFDHLACLVVTENSAGKVTAVGSLHKLLEGSFLCDKNLPHDMRLNAFNLIVRQSEVEAKRLGFKIFHSFSTNEMVNRTLIKHFGFQRGSGENLILKVEP